MKSSEYKIVNISQIKPYENNPRLIPDNAIDAVAKSIKEFGFRGAILVDGYGVILAGHTRYYAAKKLNLSEVPTIWNYNITEQQAKAFRIADNKTSELTSWDEVLFDKEVKELLEMAQNFDLSTLGLDAWEIENFTKSAEVAPFLTQPQSQEPRGQESCEKESECVNNNCLDDEEESENEIGTGEIPNLNDCFATIFWSSKDADAAQKAAMLFGSKAQFVKLPVDAFFANMKELFNHE